MITANAVGLVTIIIFCLVLAYLRFYEKFRWHYAAKISLGVTAGWLAVFLLLIATT